jgi:iron-sulfur cluster assembly accessory protein
MLANSESMTESAPISFTDAAAAKVKELRDDEGNPNLKLRVYITGGGCAGFSYGFTFDEAVNEDDTSVEKEGVTLLVDAMSIHRGVVLIHRFIESEAIGKPRTAAAGDIHTQLQVRVPFVVTQLFNFGGGGIGK